MKRIQSAVAGWCATGCFSVVFALFLALFWPAANDAEVADCPHRPGCCRHNLPGGYQFAPDGPCDANCALKKNQCPGRTQNPGGSGGSLVRKGW